jgi:YopT-type cysteine protease-like protein
MFGSVAKVRFTAQIFKGYLIEAFSQGDWNEGVGPIMAQIPEAARGVCKSLCMHWVAHHATDAPGRFSDVARLHGPGTRRNGGHYAGVGMALTQLDYARALGTAAVQDREQAKDQFTDDFLRRSGIVRQMNIKHPTRNLSPSRFKPGNNRAVNTWFGRQLATHIVGSHSKDYWSYKIISIHGRAGGHAVAAFVGADAMFFDPNYGIFYFKKADDFRQWFGEPGGFYWESNYVREIGDDFVIKSYAPKH